MFKKIVLLFAPLFILSACGGNNGSNSTTSGQFIKPTEMEFRTNIEKIKNGNVTVEGILESANEQIPSARSKIQATATKIKLETPNDSGGVETEYLSNESGAYFQYIKEENKWVKNNSSEEEFSSIKSTMIPFTLKYSNFNFDSTTGLMTNIDPVILVEGDETTTFTPIQITIVEKQISKIYAKSTTVIKTNPDEPFTSQVTFTYIYESDDFDIPLPSVE